MFRNVLCCAVLFCAALTVHAQEILNPSISIRFHSVSGAHVSPDNRYLLVADINPGTDTDASPGTSTLRIYDLETGRPPLTVATVIEQNVRRLTWNRASSEALVMTNTQLYLVNTRTA